MAKEQDNKNTAAFIKNIADQNYAAANVELTKSIEQKLKNKIQQVYNQNIFKNNESGNK